MTFDPRIDTHTRTALESAWHRDSAAASLERWLDLCAQENWGTIPQNLPLLVQVFGASWYFTRFVFYRGPAIVPLFDQADEQALQAEVVRDRIRAIDSSQPTEEALDALRIVKNEIMLQILLADLRGVLDQRALELCLSVLAEATLARALQIYSYAMAPELDNHLGVLGMGRMAGEEMNFGSDLDLIFLYPHGSQTILEQASKLIRALLRGIAMAAPAGRLYDVDMRLRPHGAAGVLITSDQSFSEYHAADRDIWQRQLMTRCRPMIDGDGLASNVLARVNGHIYADYEPDMLRREIRSMRLRVQHELGSPAGRYEIKRGRGGIMDIDFISHYLQLTHGQVEPALQVASTRTALSLLLERDYLTADQFDCLIRGYDFLKRLEGRLRVFDMKPVSSIPQEPELLVELARAMDCHHKTNMMPGQVLLDSYRTTADSIRQVFDEIVPDG